MSKQPKPDLRALIAGEVAPAVQQGIDAPEEASETSAPVVAPVAAPARPTVVATAAPAPKAAEPVPATAPAPSTPTRVSRGGTTSRRPPKLAGGTLKQRTLQAGLYLEPSVHDKLRDIAHVERVRMHDLFLEAIDLLLKKRGEPSIRELVKKASEPRIV